MLRKFISYILLNLLVFQLGNNLLFANGIEVSVTTSTPVCGEECITLLPTIEMGTATCFLWTSNLGYYNDSDFEPVVCPEDEETFTITVWNDDSGPNLITNGDFELGNTGFSSDYDFDSCPPGNQWGSLGCEGVYVLTTNSGDTHTNFPDCNALDGGIFMALNGAQGLQNVWCQTLSVNQNSKYEFSALGASIHPDSPAELQFAINGSPLSNTLSLAGTCSWLELLDVWISDANTSAEICITNLNTALSGNDFAIDNIFLGEYCKASAEITVAPISDTEPPVIVGNVADIMLDCGADIPNIIALMTTDNCDPNFPQALVPTVTESGDQCEEPLTIIRTYIATDASGNTSEPFIQTIIVRADEEAPIIESGNLVDVTLSCGEDIPFAITLVATDDCDPNFPQNVSPIESESGDGCSSDRTIIRSYEIADQCGNNAIPVIQTITIKADLENPIIESPSQIADINCQDPLPTQQTLQASDDCTQQVDVIASIDDYDIDNCSGYTITYRWTAIDECDNTAEETITFNVLPDNSIPIFDSSPANIPNVNCGDILPTPETLTATDDCDTDLEITTEVISETENMCDGYSITHIWTVVDDCNNENSTSTSFMVLPDTEAPDLVLPDDITVECNNIPPIGIATATDNCDSNPTVIFVEEIINDGSCPYTIERSWYAEDICGNASDIQTQTITVGDTENPEILNIPSDITLDCFSDFEAIIPDLNWIDNCTTGGIVIGSEEPNSSQLDCNGGEFIRTWEVIDACNNVTTETQSIVILPKSEVEWIGDLPVDITINCGEEIPELPNLNYANTDNGFCAESGTVPVFDDGADLINCGDKKIYSWLLEEDENNCINELLHTITISVQDTENPTFINPPLDLTIDCYTDIPIAEELQWEDNCSVGGFSIAAESDIFSECSGGEIIRTWTAIDDCGNEEIYEQTIEVEAINLANWVVTLPIDITIQCGEDPPPFISLDYSNNESNEGCIEEGTISPIENGSLNQPGDQLTLTWEYESFCGNILSHTQTITVGEIPDALISGSTSFCPGSSTILGLTESYNEYNWSNGSNEPEIEVSEENTYIVTVTDINGCTTSTEIEITIDNELFPSIDGSETICPDESITLDVGNGFINYLWNDGSEEASITIYNGGWYSITVSDDNGCEGTAEIYVEEVEAEQVEILGDLSVCLSDLAILNASEGFSIYEWENGAIGSEIVAEINGDYTVTATDNNGCISSTSVELEYVDNPEPIIIVEEEFCQGESITLELNESYDLYLWSTDSENTSIEINEPGTYSVTITDENECTGVATTTITPQSALNVTIQGSPSFCEGGYTTLSAEGWSSYFWSNNEISSSIQVESEGLYSLTVTDENGCEATADINITVQNSLNPSISGPTTICPNSSITLNTENGYTSYLWSNNENTQEISITEAGLYAITVTDNSNCSGIAEINIVESIPSEISILGNLSFCQGSTTTLTVDGDWQNYVWSNNATANTIQVVEAENYSVTVTDANGCTNSSEVTVSEQINPTPIIDGPTELCSGSTISLQTTNTYNSYYWNNGETTETISVSNAGIYSLTVTDDLGCTGTSNTNIISLIADQVIIGGSTSFCSNSSTTLDGGDNYTSWNWSTGESSQIISINTEGSYSVTVTDQNNCTSSSQVLVTEESSLSPVITGDLDFCFGESGFLSSGEFSSWNWNGPSGTYNTQQIEISEEGTYTLEVTDASGCSGSSTVEVKILETPTPQIIGNLNICPDTETILSLNESFSTYEWNNGNQSQNFTINEPNTYSVTVTDFNGCKASSSVEVVQENIPNFDIINTECAEDGMTYSITFSTDGDTFEINNNELNTIENTDGTFSIFQIDTSENVSIIITNSVTTCLANYDIEAPNCGCGAKADIGSGVLTCEIENIILGGGSTSIGPEFLIEWFDENGNPLGNTVELLVSEPGMYTMVVTDLILNCEDIATYSVAANQDPPMANILVDPSNIIDCSVESVFLSVDDPQPGIMYNWQIDDYALPNEISIEVSNTAEVSLVALDTVTLCSSMDVENIINGEEYPAITIGQPLDLNCFNHTIVIDATETVTGENIQQQWYDENMIPIANANSTSLEVQEPGTYYLQNTDVSNGCELIESINITENTISPEINAGEDLSIPCNENGVLINATILSSFSEDLTLQWSFEGNILNSVTNNLNPIFNQEGIYQLTVIDNINGCSASDSVNINMENDIPTGLNFEIEFSPCGDYTDGEIIIQETIGGTAPYEYLVNETSLNGSSITNLSAGEYTIQVIDSKGCSYEETIELPTGNNINVFASPNNFILTNGDEGVVNLITNLDDNINYIISWDNEEGVSCTNCLSDIVLNPTTSQDYNITLIDENGCIDSTSIRVTVRHVIDIYIPTVFTPDEIGENQYFTVFTDENIITLTGFKIYDRWGELIFTTPGDILPNVPHLGWNGIYNNKPANPGVYVYIVEYKDIDGNKGVSVGDITLVR